jgi:hypothetical protein
MVSHPLCNGPLPPHPELVLVPEPKYTDLLVAVLQLWFAGKKQSRSHVNAEDRRLYDGKK